MSLVRRYEGVGHGRECDGEEKRERERLGQVRRRARNPCNAGTYAVRTAFRMHREMSRGMVAHGEDGGSWSKWVLLGSY